MVLEDGSVYEGDIKNGLPNGQGTMRYPGHEWHEDLFFDSSTWIQLRAGEEKHIPDIGDRSGHETNVYKGSFRDGKRHGHGKVEFANGSWFDGFYSKGTPYMGQGKFYAAGDPDPKAMIELKKSPDLGISIWFIWPRMR